MPLRSERSERSAFVLLITYLLLTYYLLITDLLLTCVCLRCSCARSGVFVVCFLGVGFGLVPGVVSFVPEAQLGPHLGPFWGPCWTLFGIFLGVALASSFKVDVRCDFDRSNLDQAIDRIFD